MIKRILYAIIAVTGTWTACVMAADNETKIPVELNNYQEEKTILSLPNEEPQVLDKAGTLNLKYTDGTLYVNYDCCRLGGPFYAVVPDVYLDENNTLHIEWDNLYSHNIESMLYHRIDCSYNVRHTGRISVSDRLCKWANILGNKEKKNIELDLYEGMDMTIPIDRYQSLLPNDYYRQIWLYGYVQNGKLTGRFATVRCVYLWPDDNHKTELSEVRRTESDVFDENNSRIMGYIRDDGLKHYVTPVNDNLPYDLWIDGMEGSFNPWKMTGGEDFTPYEFYPQEGFFISKDFILDNYSVHNITGQRDIWQDFYTLDCNWYSYASIVRELTLDNDIRIREDLGMYGNCANDILYPSLAGSDGTQPRLQLICSKYFKSATRWMMVYADPELYQQYNEYLASVDTIGEEKEMDLSFNGTEVTLTGYGEGCIDIYSIDGIRVVTAAGTGTIKADTSGLNSGIYIAKAGRNGQVATKTIHIK